MTGILVHHELYNKKWPSNRTKYLVSESSYEPRTFPISYKYKCCPLHRVSRSTSATKALSFTRDKVQIQNFAGHETPRCPRYPGYQLLSLGDCEQTPGQGCSVTTIPNVIYHLTVTARFSQTGVVWRTSVLHHQCDCMAWWITFKNLRYRLKKITRLDFAELHPQRMIQFLFFCLFAKIICINPPINFDTSVYPSVSQVAFMQMFQDNYVEIYEI
jgi:hypothetical protein